MLVDDDPLILALVDAFLAPAGCQVAAAASVFQARRALAKRAPDLLILDRGLPDGDGLEFLRELRRPSEHRSLPVLILSSRDAPQEKARGLDAGGDDYLGKPFSGVELAARVRALLKRGRRDDDPARSLNAGGLIMNLDELSVELDGKPVTLPRREFELLRAFLEKPGHLFRRRFLLERVWGAGAELKMNSKTVDVAVGRLRAHLGSWGERIETVPASGYRLNVRA